MSTAFNDVPVEGATCVEEAAPLGVRLKRNFNYSFGQAPVCTHRFWASDREIYDGGRRDINTNWLS